MMASYIDIIKQKSALLLVLLAIILTSCQNQERASVPVINAPNRVDTKDVPPDGVVPVEPGDTIYTMANRYGVTPRKIILGNQLKPPYLLDGLTTLVLPKPRDHRVKPGDTIDALSERYAVTRHELIRLNQLKAPYTLRPGTTIAIPRALDYSMLDLPGINPSSNIKVVPEAEISANTASSAASSIPDSIPTKPVPAGALAFGWPANGKIIETYGLVSSGVKNDGINIAGNLGDAVYSSYDGTVAFIGKELKSFGNMVLIKHDNGWITAYAHLGDVQVTEGQMIAKGEVIGTIGNSGKVNQPQLHFQIRKSRQPVDPLQFMS
ncbi:MAG: peptidoglycan DD-metalloendopeptidase family protein [Alphaproteobacteria bacterium]|nr:peptidoglycan DD-metalloendopeptidase family protein [Alphaproteobacteria bacterium]